MGAVTQSNMQTNIISFRLFSLSFFFAVGFFEIAKIFSPQRIAHKHEPLCHYRGDALRGFSLFSFCVGCSVSHHRWWMARSWRNFVSLLVGSSFINFCRAKTLTDWEIRCSLRICCADAEKISISISMAEKLRVFSFNWPLISNYEYSIRTFDEILLISHWLRMATAVCSSFWCTRLNWVDT